MSPTTASGPVADLLNRPVPAYWSLSFYPDAREAGGAFVPYRGGGVKGQAADPARARAEAARRAKGKLRRYCTANRLNRLGTLTYREFERAGWSCQMTDGQAHWIPPLDRSGPDAPPQPPRQPAMRVCLAAGHR